MEDNKDTNNQGAAPEIAFDDPAPQRNLDKIMEDLGFGKF